MRSDVAGSAIITVNAVHARYASGPGGILPQGQSAEAIIGQVVCRAVGPDVNVATTTTTVPPQDAPTTTSLPVTTTVPSVPVATTVSGSLASTGYESRLALSMLVLWTAILL